MKQSQFLLLILIASCYGCSKQSKAVSAEIYSDFQKGSAFWEKNDDSAFYYFNKVANSAKDSLYIATAHFYMGAIQHNSGDYFGSQETVLKSLEFLDARNKQHHPYLSSDYNELAMSNANLRNYSEAIRYYDLALQFAQDDISTVIFSNNKAVLYEKIKNYGQAISIYHSVIDNSKKYMEEYARVVSNLAKAQWLQNSSYHPLPEFWEALKIRMDSNYKWGLNASYAHLSDYYSRSQTDSALIYATKMYSIAQEINSPDDQLEALQKLIKLSAPDVSKKYFDIYSNLNDSIQTARAAAKNQFALIRYQVKEKEADNFRLQKDNAEKELLLYGTVILFLAAATIATMWYRKRKQRLAWELQNKIREHQLKTSQKVHDVVANGLYRIITGIEHRDTIDKEPLLDELEVLYEKSRDISHEQHIANQQEFHQLITELLMTFATPTTKILVVGNYEHSWKGVSEEVKNELEHILQELMVNMRKHSRAHNVVLKFERQDDLIRIQYTDDGIGVPSTFQFGNGLTNTENRIKAIGGKLIFDKTKAKGIKVEFFFPVA